MDDLAVRILYPLERCSVPVQRGILSGIPTYLATETTRHVTGLIGLASLQFTVQV